MPVMPVWLDGLHGMDGSMAEVLAGWLLLLSWLVSLLGLFGLRVEREREREREKSL